MDSNGRSQPASRTRKIAKQNTLNGKAFAATELLFSLGDPKTEVYLIESGVVAVYEPRLQGRQAIIELAFPGDIVGLGFLQTHTCSARASVETVAHCVPFSAQDRLVGDDPRSQAGLANAIEREFEFLRRSSIKFSREILSDA